LLKLNLSEVLSSVQLEPQPGSGIGDLRDQLFPRVSIDSRTIKAGEAFFAIKGERFDGHQFLPQVLEQGARVLVLSDTTDLPPLPEGCVCLKTEDTTAALQRLAAFVREQWGKKLLAITGSMGKTTTRHFTASLLGAGQNVLQSAGNLNNHIGLPLTLLEIDEHHDSAVVELGMNHPGEISQLSSICHPNGALITNVAPVHTEFFTSILEVAEAKGEILDYLDPAGTYFYNADDLLVAGLRDQFSGRHVSFGLGADADYQVTEFQFKSLQDMAFSIEGPGCLIKGSVPFVGKHFLYNIAAATAVALESNLEPQAVQSALNSLRPLPQRGQILECAGITIWDDTYNSNPEAVNSLLETLLLVKGYRRKILVLGDMLELGHESAHYHRQVGRKAANSRLDYIFTVGPEARNTGDEAGNTGFPQAHIDHFDDNPGAAKFLKQFLQSGDLVLIKGSRGVRMEVIAETLRGVGS
jgi:UDP-N-acetylmuramoyl-tripeptide--D-alanyl-D-alanine ligase